MVYVQSPCKVNTHTYSGNSDTREARREVYRGENISYNFIDLYTYGDMDYASMAVWVYLH